MRVYCGLMGIHQKVIHSAITDANQHDRAELFKLVKGDKISIFVPLLSFHSKIYLCYVYFSPLRCYIMYSFIYIFILYIFI